MNDEIKPLYIPESSGNTLPNLSKHPAHNETPVPLHRTRTDPSRAMSAEPQKYLLPAGPELRDIIRRRIEAASQSTQALWASLNQSYQTRPRQEQALIEVVGDVPRTWRRKAQHEEPKKMDGVCPATRPAETEPEAALLTEEQTRAVLLERIGYGVCPAEPVIADVMRLSGWDESGVAMLIDTMTASGDLDTHADGSISRPMVRSETSDADVIVAILDAVDNGYHDEAAITLGVGQRTGWSYSAMYPLIEDMINDSILIRVNGKLYRHVQSEQPPTYEIGDDDDGEIPEPGVGRPVARHVPDSVAVVFVRTDDVGREYEYNVELDADGLCFGGGEVLSFEAIDAVMPVLRRVHRAVFGES